MDILYSGRLAEAIGRERETIAPPDGIEDVAGLVGWLALRDEGHADVLGDLSQMSYLIDGTPVGPDAPIDNARELAISRADAARWPISRSVP